MNDNDQYDIEQNIHNRNILKNLNSNTQNQSSNESTGEHKKNLKKLDDIPAEQYDYDASYDVEQQNSQ